MDEGTDEILPKFFSVITAMLEKHPANVKDRPPPATETEQPGPGRLHQALFFGLVYGILNSILGVSVCYIYHGGWNLCTWWQTGIIGGVAGILADFALKYYCLPGRATLF